MQQATTDKNAMKNETIVERTSDRELTVTRTFDAPAHIVFDAWTKPELLKRWWAPKSFGVSLFECEQDVRVGGAYRFAFGRDPKNPRDADSGEGCADSIERQSLPTSIGFSVEASRPHRMATIGCRRFTKARIAHSVTASHPLPRWDAELPGWTVSTRLSSSTPRWAHGVRSPFDGFG